MSKPTNTQSRNKVAAYNDDFNEDRSTGIVENGQGYRFRLIDGVMMPPYVTPAHFELSRTVTLRENDICFCSYPKSGSTWLSQILLLLVNNGLNPSDQTLRQHMIWAESSWPFPCTREEIDAMNSPRIFKSHMPQSLSLGGAADVVPARQIYIARNPKDVCVSYYHFETGKEWSGGFECDWDEWFELFLKGEIQRGDWFDHVLSWWARANDANLLFIKYENLLRNFDSEVVRLAQFLDIQISNDVLASVRTQSSFDHMKQSGFSNMHEVEQLDTFYRKGVIGSWKEEFSNSQNERMDALIESRLTPVGLSFLYS